MLRGGHLGWGFRTFSVLPSPTRTWGGVEIARGCTHSYLWIAAVEPLCSAPSESLVAEIRPEECRSREKACTEETRRKKQRAKMSRQRQERLRWPSLYLRHFDNGSKTSKTSVPE
jgi:hypothetical protein